ncbi:MAG: hypothetical protein WD749_12355 [Phycisphaerales bacterium]
MRLKGVNPLEQHLEKVVLAVVGAVFLVALALQFLGEPNAVRVGRGDQTVAPGKAYDAIANKARTLSGRLNQAEPAELATAREKVGKINLNLTEEFRKRKDAPVSPPLARAIDLGPAMALKTEEITVHGVDAPIVALKVPAPVSPIAVATRNTIDPTEAITYPDLKPLLPPEQPLDKASVSVEARFDGTALKAAFLAVPGDANSRPIPGQWWRETTALMDVRLERQEQSTGGDWGEPVVVKAAPGRTDMADAVKSLQTTVEMEDMVFQARDLADGILRPAFYRTIAGPAWMTPAEQAAAAAAGGRPPQVDTLLAQRRGLVATEQRLIKQIDDASKQAPPRPPPRSGGGGGDGGGRRGGGGNQPPAPTRDPNAERQTQLQRLQDRLQQVRDDIRKVDDRLRELGYDETGTAVKVEAPAAAGEAAKPLLDSPSIQLWAHDLTVESGKTYRYRVQVAINNPAFGRGTALVQEQQDLAKSPLLLSEASEWSPPVRVMSDRYYFVTGASEPDQLSSAHASVELYEFFYGYYRKGSTTVEPGDVLMARLNLPPGDRLPIFDLEKPAGETPGGQAPPQPPPATPPPAPPAGPGKGGPVPGGTPREPRQEGPAQQPDQPVLPTNAAAWTKQLFATVDVILLDVARPSDSPETPRALLRVADGSIEVRDPADDKASEMYKRVAQSAKEGDNQGMPAVGPGGPAPDGPRGPVRTPDAPKAPPGGGGGGAGGG